MFASSINPLVALPLAVILIALAYWLLKRSTSALVQTYLGQIEEAGIGVLVEDVDPPNNRAFLQYQGQSITLDIAMHPIQPMYWTVALVVEMPTHHGEDFWMTSSKNGPDLFGERKGESLQSGDPSFDDTYAFGGDSQLVERVLEEQELRDLLLQPPLVSMLLEDGQFKLMHRAHGPKPPSLHPEDWAHSFALLDAMIHPSV